jgi:hypothetical protein
MKEPQFLQNRNEMTSDGDCDQLLDQILKTDIMIPLPEDFADRVAMKAIKRIALKQSLREFWIYTGVIAGVSVTFLSVMYLSNNENVKKWLDFLIPNISLMIGIILILFFVLLFDRVILPQFFLRRREKNLYI